VIVERSLDGQPATGLNASYTLEKRKSSLFWLRITSARRHAGILDYGFDVWYD